MSDDCVKNAGEAGVQVVAAQALVEVAALAALGDDAVLAEHAPVVTGAALGHVREDLLARQLGAGGGEGAHDAQPHGVVEGGDDGFDAQPGSVGVREGLHGTMVRLGLNSPVPATTVQSESKRPARGHHAMSDLQIHHETATTFHRALITKNWDLLRSIMDPEVSWVLPGTNTISGEAVGIEAVVARAELIASYGLTFTLEQVLLSRDNMALALHNTAERMDAVLDEHLATVCTLRAGKITAVETFLSDVDGMDAFFIPLD